MIFTALASSSAGNAYILDDGDTRILLECGISHKKLQALSGFSLSRFAACLVSHEHKDHSRAVQELIRDGMTVYMSEGTADALNVGAVSRCRSMEQFNIGSLDIVPFATFHDAAEPLGFLVQSRTDGDTLAFATDTVNLRYKFPGLNILAIEANFDAEILARCDKMPETVKKRICNTHMDIDVLCDYLRSMDLSQCREIHLLHLSDATSHEGHFINKVARIAPPGTVISAACRQKMR